MSCTYCDAAVDGGCRSAVSASACLRAQLARSGDHLRVAQACARAEMKLRADAEKRRFALVAAVALCMNDERLTDLGTLKRTWFFAETGRDEPVGSRTWEELRVMVREHCFAPARPRHPMNAEGD